jgi:hypothetical protein
MLAKTLFALILLSSFLFSSSNYTVRLAVFKNASKLQKSIDAFPPALKKTVRTYTKNGLTYAHSIPTADKSILEKLLPAYKKIFKDAYIAPTRMK